MFALPADDLTHCPMIPLMAVTARPPAILTQKRDRFH
jgi:hypothetical protein